MRAIITTTAAPTPEAYLTRCWSWWACILCRGAKKSLCRVCAAPLALLWASRGQVARLCWLRSAKLRALQPNSLAQLADLVVKAVKLSRWC